ncbi:hypothetical protein ABK040_001320 [Willaertia magna]
MEINHAICPEIEKKETVKKIEEEEDEEEYDYNEDSDSDNENKEENYFTMDEYFNMQNNRFLRGKFLFNMSSESLRIDKRELYNIKNEILSDFKDLEMQVPPKKKEEENKTNLVKDEVDDGSVDNLLIDCSLEALPWEIE